MPQEFLSQNGYGGIGNVALGAVHSIVIVVADSHRCGGWIRTERERITNPMRTPREPHANSYVFQGRNFIFGNEVLMEGVGFGWRELM